MQVGILDRRGRHIHGPQHLLEFRLILDKIEHIGKRHQLGAGDLVGDEGIEAFPPVLAVDDDIEPGLFLQGHGPADLVFGDGVEFGTGYRALLVAAQHFQQSLWSAARNLPGWFERFCFHS